MREERLKRVAEISVSNVDKKTAEDDIPVALCNYTDVYYNERITSSLDFMSATATPGQLRKFRLRRGDVVLTKDSETPEDIGISAWVAEDVPDLVCGYHLAIVRAFPERADGRYLRWVIASALARQRMSAAATGVTRFGLRAEEIADVRSPLPPIDRQCAIADYLDRETARIDALIEAKRRMVELLKDRRARSIAREILGFTSRDPSMPAQEWVSALQTNWQTTTLGRCLTRVTYGFTNPMPTVDEGPHLLTANDIGDGVIKYSTARRTSEEAYLTAITEKSRPCAGDVLVTKDGTLGRVALADGERACINQSIALLRPSAVLDPSYLAALLRSTPYQQLMRFQAGGTTIKHIYISRITKMPIPVPPLKDQRYVASIVREIDVHHDSAVKNLERSIGLLQERRQALITAAVTGQLDIPESA